jgi:hypothetical protein
MNFSLNGSSTDSTWPSSQGGTFVRTTAMPDCTGTQLSIQPVAVSNTIPCRPWSAFTHNERRAM